MKLIRCVSRPRFHTTMAPNLSNKERAVLTWREADAVCFDVDSTVIQDEGLDQIAEFCGVGDKVKEMTRNAMGGKVTFRKALADRLQLIKPSRQQIEAVVSKPGLNRLAPGMRELVRKLQARGTEVFWFPAASTNSSTLWPRCSTSPS